MLVLQFHQHYIYIAGICWDASCDRLALLLTFQRFLLNSGRWSGSDTSSTSLTPGSTTERLPLGERDVSTVSSLRDTKTAKQRSVVVTLFPSNAMLQNHTKPNGRCLMVCLPVFPNNLPLLLETQCHKHHPQMAMVFTDEKFWWRGGCHLWPARMCHIRSYTCTDGMISDCHGWYQIWKDIWFPIDAIGYYWFLVTLVLGYWTWIIDVLTSLINYVFSVQIVASDQFVAFDQVTWDEDIIWYYDDEDNDDEDDDDDRRIPCQGVLGPARPEEVLPVVRLHVLVSHWTSHRPGRPIPWILQ